MNIIRVFLVFCFVNLKSEFYFYGKGEFKKEVYCRFIVKFNRKEVNFCILKVDFEKELLLRY